MEETKKLKHKTIDCHPSLLEILDKIREDVRYRTWDVVTPSYYEATKILAKKIEKSVTL